MKILLDTLPGSGQAGSVMKNVRIGLGDDREVIVTTAIDPQARVEAAGNRYGTLRTGVDLDLSVFEDDDTASAAPGPAPENVSHAGDGTPWA